MAINANILTPRLADRRLYLAAAIAFPLLVLIGYSRTYYLSEFFNARPLANGLVHAHAAIMTTWVAYFTAQILLVRTKNLKLHMTMGFAGIALAALVVVVGMSAAYDAHLVRKSAPLGIDPYGFFAIPLFDMATFIILFAGAIYYRKRPAEHKSLMLLTAVNFLPAAIARIPVVPVQFIILWADGLPDLLALAGFAFYTWKHKKFNWAFCGGFALVVASQIARMPLMSSPTFINLIGSIAPN
jgi:hypothetical protein